MLFMGIRVQRKEGSGEMDGLPHRSQAGKDSGGQLLGCGGLQPGYQNAGIFL